jgi:DNA-binding transcriptional regulator YdaS (Cro superfamily)
MNLQNYINSLSLEELQEFADRADTSVAYIKQLATGHRKAGAKSIFNLIAASGGVLTPESLRPDFKKTA